MVHQNGKGGPPNINDFQCNLIITNIKLFFPLATLGFVTCFIEANN